VGAGGARLAAGASAGVEWAWARGPRQADAGHAQMRAPAREPKRQATGEPKTVAGRVGASAQAGGCGARRRRASGLASPGASARAAARGSGSALALGTGRCRSMGKEASDDELEPEQALAHGWLRRGANGSSCGSRQGGSRRTGGCSSW
jgi:hypothetical protein